MVASIKPHRDELGLGDGLMLIDGRWVPAADAGTWSHIHPATGEQVASFPVAGPADVDLAVRAARRAFDEGPWPRARANERIRVLRTIADLVREHADELLKLQALDNSVPLSFGEIYAMSADFVADVFDHHAGWVDKLAGETLPPYQGGDHMVLTLREPVGVVGAVIPWNAPLALFAQKVAPGPGGRLHHRAQAVGVRHVRGAPAGQADRRGVRPAARRAQRGHRARRSGRTGTDQPPDGGQAVVHRQPGGRAEVMTGRGRRVQAGQPRTRRQEPRRWCSRTRDVGTAAAVTMGTVTLGLSGQVCAAQTRALVHRDAVEEFLATAEMIGTMVSYGNPFDPRGHLGAADQHPPAGPGARPDRPRPGGGRPPGLRRQPRRRRPRRGQLRHADPVRRRVQ